MAALAAIASLAQAQTSLTVEQAVQEGLERSIGVRVAQSQTRQAEQRSRQALGLLGFRFDSQATYERYAAKQGFGPGTGSIDAKRVSFVLSYPVDLVGLGRKAADAARATEAGTRESVTVEEISAKQQIREAFYNVLRSQWNLDVQREALKAAEDRLEVARRQFVAGNVARFDVLRLETEVQRNQSAVLASENAVRLTKQVLNNAMSRDVSTEFQLETPFADVRKASLPTFDLSEGKLLALAEANRPEIRQLNKFLVARRFFTLTERGGNTPSLNLQAIYTRTFDPQPFTRENQTTLAANLSFPLWDSGITRARVRAAKEDERQVELNLERTRLGISLEVQSSVVRLRDALSQVTFAEKVVELQTEALRLAELRYSAGEGILLDVTTADADLRAALGNLVNARSEYLIALAALQKAVGTDDLPTVETAPK